MASNRNEGAPAHNPPPPTQLDFSQAMTDFEVMFPDMDAEVIEAVLRANNGAVDATIDHLLSMTADNESQPATEDLLDLGATAAGPSDPFSAPPAMSAKASQVAAILKSGGKAVKSSQQPPSQPPTYKQAVQTGDLINLGEPPEFGASMQDSATGAAPANLLADLNLSSLKQNLAYSHPQRQESEKEEMSCTSPRHTTVVPTQAQLQEIYEENLRLREAAKSSADAQQRAQFLEDERVALMLQNEEFMAELRRDHEFMTALEMDPDMVAASVAAGAAGTSSGGGSGNSSKTKPSMDEAVFRERLKNMGKTSKRKFAQMASLFSRTKGAKQLLGHAPAPSKDNLLLNAEPLVNEDSEDDNNEDPKTKGKYTSFS